METFGFIVAWVLSVGSLVLSMGCYLAAGMASRRVTDEELRVPRLLGIAGLAGIVLLVVFS